MKSFSAAILAMLLVVMAIAIGVVVDRPSQAGATASVTTIDASRTDALGGFRSTTTGISYFGTFSNGVFAVDPNGQLKVIIDASLGATLCHASTVANGDSGLAVADGGNGTVLASCVSWGAVYSFPDSDAQLTSASQLTLVYQIDPSTCANAQADGSYNPEGSILAVARAANGDLWFDDYYNTDQLYVHRAGSAAGSCIVANAGDPAWNLSSGPTTLVFGSDGMLYFALEGPVGVYKVDPATGADTQFASAASTCPGSFWTSLNMSANGTIFLQCYTSSGGVTMIPRNADGSAGTPQVVFPYTGISSLSNGNYAFVGGCNGVFDLENWRGSPPAGVVQIGTVTEALCVPNAPTATAGAGQATVSWGSLGAEVTSYTVTASTGQTCTASAPATSCTVTGLAVGTPVTFTVAAVYAGGTSSPSAASNSVTPTVAPTPVVPAEVTATRLASTGDNFAILLMVAGFLGLSGVLIFITTRRRKERSA